MKVLHFEDLVPDRVEGLLDRFRFSFHIVPAAMEKFDKLDLKRSATMISNNAISKKKIILETFIQNSNRVCF